MALFVVVLISVIAGLALLTAVIAVLVERAVPPVGRTVKVGGETLHVLEAGRPRGEAPTLLMVHGLGAQLRNFTHSLTPLLERDYHLVLVDRPGAGYSTRQPGSDASLHHQAQLVGALADALGLEKPWVVGHSLGGALALTLAQQREAQLSGLLLLAPLTAPVTEAPKVFAALTLQQPWLRAFVAWVLATPLSIARSKAVIDAIFGPDAMPANFPVAGGSLLTLRPQSFIHAAQDLAAVGASIEGIAAGCQTLRLPVAVLYGRDDRILDAQLHGVRLAERLPGARCELIAGGHMIPVTAPAACADFIRRHSAA